MVDQDALEAMRDDLARRRKIQGIVLRLKELGITSPEDMYDLLAERDRLKAWLDAYTPTKGGTH